LRIILEVLKLLWNWLVLLIVNTFYISYLVVGKDADSMFEDIGHSKEARNTMKTWMIGTLKSVPGSTSNPPQAKKQQVAEIKSKGGLSPMVVLVVLIALALGIFFSQKK
jgi:cytochrome b5